MEGFMLIVLITFLSFIANVIGTISGFGLSTVMTPVLLWFLPFHEVILLVCVVHWFHDVMKMWFFREGITWSIVGYFGFTGILASVFGAYLVTEPPEILMPLLGFFLIGYVILLFVHPTFKIAYTWLNGLIGGAVSGFFAGIFGIRGAIKTTFLSMYNLPKIAFLGTTSTISFFIDTTRWITYTIEGITMQPILWWGLLLFVPASIFGVWLGQYLVDKVPQKYFRWVVAVFLLITGIRLIVNSIMS